MERFIRKPDILKMLLKLQPDTWYSIHSMLFVDELINFIDRNGMMPQWYLEFSDDCQMFRFREPSDFEINKIDLIA